MVVSRDTPTIPTGAPDAAIKVDAKTVGNTAFFTGIHPHPTSVYLPSDEVVVVGVNHFARRVGEIHRRAIRASVDAVGVFLPVESRLLNPKETMLSFGFNMPCITQAALRGRSGE